MRVFHLYAFSDGNITVITRGENEEQAMSYASRDGGSFKRGVTVFPVNYLSIDAAKLYDKNHSKGWLYRAPVWLQRLEQKQAINLGLKEVIRLISSRIKLEPLMYK